MRPFIRQHKALTLGFAAATLFVIGGSYTLVRIHSLSSRIDQLVANVAELDAGLASTTEALRSSIQETHLALSSELSTQQQNVGKISEQLGDFKDEVGDLSGSLTTLEKLAQTDRELLKKYSKVYFLSDTYVPTRLEEVPLQIQYSEHKQLLFHADALPYLEDMIRAASSSDVQMYVFSAYRSFAEQKALKGAYSVTYGAGTANSFSADQGYSEHQLGTTVDLIAPGQGGVLDGFDQTAAYQWLLKNAYKYGFVISYPKNNGYYVFEPWHWRFVGKDLAGDLHRQGKQFYDLDQRTIDGYLANVFD